VGILTAFAALLLGQLAAALALDASGAFGLPVHPVTPTRVLALALVAGGLLLSRA
jgi:transporter family-2 protein